MSDGFTEVKGPDPVLLLDLIDHDQFYPHQSNRSDHKLDQIHQAAGGKFIMTDHDPTLSDQFQLISKAVRPQS